jgi:hypothetical protein
MLLRSCRQWLSPQLALIPKVGDGFATLAMTEIWVFQQAHFLFSRIIAAGDPVVRVIIGSHPMGTIRRNSNLRMDQNRFLLSQE